MEDSMSTDPEQKQAAERQAEEATKFIVAIVTCLNQQHQPRKQRHEKDPYWPTIQSQVHESLMKLPARINLDFLLLYMKQNSCSLMFACNTGTYPGSVLRNDKVNNFLNILIACGFSVKKVSTHNTAQSTENLLQTLQSSRSEVPSLLDLSYTSVRSRLPQPVSDEVLDRTKLPKLLYENVRREALLADVMENLQS